MDKINHLISKDKAASLLGCSIRTIERLICSGSLKKIKIRGSVKVQFTQVMKIVEEGC